LRDFWGCVNSGVCSPIWMALGDLMVSRFSQSSVSLVSNHRYDEDCISSHDDGDSRRKDSEAKSSSSYGNGTTEGAATATSMAYLPQTIVLCELRHDASEASAPLGTSEIVLVPKWRLKERVSFQSNIVGSCKYVRLACLVQLTM